MNIELRPIGTVHSPLLDPGEIRRERNIRPDGFADIRGEIELYQDYEAGLADIDGFSHLYILFHFHQSPNPSLTAHPPFDNKARGVFATRSPHRPNPLGLTVVRLLGRKSNRLFIADMDMIEGTPVLDIKPYTLRDRKDDISLGWLEPYRDASQ